MAAGLGFKTFTTGEVLTAADTNGYLMQGVLVFASSAARAAAITSPQEGQYSYLKDTNSTEYYDGAAWIAAPIGDITGVTAGTGISGGGTSGTVTITNSMATEIAAKGDLIVGTGAATFDNLTVGTNGQTLVADSSTATGLKWAAASSGSIVLLNRTAFSAVSSQSINSVFSSTYTNYQVIINGYSSALADMKFNYRLSGTDATANSYRSALATYDDLGTYAFIGGTATYLKLGKIVDSSTQRSVWNMIVAEPTANNRKGLSFTGWNGQTKIYWGGGDYIGSDSSAYDGFTLSCSTGTMTGSVAVYGWKES